MGYEGFSAPAAHTVRESKWILVLGCVTTLAALGVAYLMFAVNLSSATQLLLGACLAILVVCAGFFLALYFNYYVKIDPAWVECRTVGRKLTHLSYEDVTEYVVAKVSGEQILRLYGAEGERIDISSKAYEIKAITNYLDAQDGTTLQ